MPRCVQCGNSKSLVSTLFVPPGAPGHTPPYGLFASFHEDGSISAMECRGANLDDAQDAFEEPFRYFNTCPFCGGGDIDWQV